jgi:hypothetical protein
MENKKTVQALKENVHVIICVLEKQCLTGWILKFYKKNIKCKEKLMWNFCTFTEYWNQKGTNLTQNGTLIIPYTLTDFRNGKDRAKYNSNQSDQNFQEVNHQFWIYVTTYFHQGILFRYFCNRVRVSQKWLHYFPFIFITTCMSSRGTKRDGSLE